MMQPGNIGLVILLLALIGCSKIQYDVAEGEIPSGAWEFCMTRGGAPVGDTLTLRASLTLHNFDTLMSDGTYCRYNKTIDDDLLWYYPCRVNAETGEPLDSYGNPIDLTSGDVFERLDKDSKYALRAPANQNYNLVLSSPAVRMKRFINNNVDNKTDTVRYGFKLDRNNELFISDPLKGVSVAAVWTNGNYVCSLSDLKLYDRRSKVTVKVACGALGTANLHAVHFENVMTSAYYMPITKSYEMPVMDGGYENPLDFYATNTYFSLGDGGEVTGDKLVVPDDAEDIVLIQEPDPTVDVENYQEWNKSDNIGNIVTAIADFPIFSLDYSSVVNDKYRHEGQIPKVVVYTGQRGNIRSSVSLPVNFEPMKSYTVIIYVSSTYVQAELYVTEWDDVPVQDVKFGEAIELRGDIEICDWINHEDQNGKVTNTYDE